MVEGVIEIAVRARSVIVRVCVCVCTWPTTFDARYDVRVFRGDLVMRLCGGSGRGVEMVKGQIFLCAIDFSGIRSFVRGFLKA